MASEDNRGRDRSWSEGRGGGDPWRGGGRYGAAYDQDRAGYRLAPQGGYGGQEYGMEGGRDHRTTSERDPAWRGDERETDRRQPWRAGEGEPYGEMELNARDRGIQDFGAPADYAYHPPAGHELDPEYLQWREARMRDHDRDYDAWRGRQQQSYDDEYRKHRDRRRNDG